MGGLAGSVPGRARRAPAMRAKTAHIFLALSVAPLAGAQDARFFSDPVGYVNAHEQEAHGGAGCAASCAAGCVAGRAAG